MKKTRQKEVRMMPSHPDYPQVNYILALLGMLTNPQVHFNTSKFLKQASNFSPLDQKIGEQERKAMIKELKITLAELFKNKLNGLSLYTEFLSEIDFDDAEFDAESIAKKFDVFVESFHRTSLD